MLGYNAHPHLVWAIRGEVTLNEIIMDCDEAVTKLWMIVVDVDDRVDEMSVIPIAICVRPRQPFAEALRCELEYPASRSDSNTVSGEFTNQRVRHFGEMSFSKNAAARRRSAMF